MLCENHVRHKIPHYIQLWLLLLDGVSVDPSDIYSDHALVTCRPSITAVQAAAAERLVRGRRRVDRDVLFTALTGSPLCCPVADDADVDELFAQYDDVLRDIADRLAPLHVICRPAARLAPWFDDASCRNARRQCRRLERHYRRTHKAEDRRLWFDATRSRFRLHRSKKEAFWLRRLSQQGRSPTLLWRSLSTTLGDTSGTTGHMADDFVAFFRWKVDDMMAATAGQPAPTVVDSTPSTLSSFRPCSEKEV